MLNNVFSHDNYPVVSTSRKINSLSNDTSNDDGDNKRYTINQTWICIFFFSGAKLIEWGLPHSALDHIKTHSDTIIFD